MSKNLGFLVFFSMLLLIPLGSNSEALLWDLQIEANVENSPLYSGERPIVSGIIIDHASKPVQKATVNVKSETMSIFTTTSQSGEFQVELGKHERLPGNYIVNISANSTDGKTGISSIQFQIRGELAHATANLSKLSTPEAQMYLDSSPEDFENNPVGFMLYNYYQKLYQDSLKDEEISQKITQERILKQEQNEEASKLRLQAINEFNPNYGVFEGPEYEEYVNSLDEGVRDIVVEHLNFTKNLFSEAQIIKNEILENGGTAEEAQEAYLKSLTVTREMIETINNNSNKNKQILDENSNETSTEEIAISGGYKVENNLIQEAYNQDAILPPNVDKISNEPIYQDAVLPPNVDKISNEPIYQDAVLPPNVDKISAESPIRVNVDGINVEVSFIESIFYVNVNGTILEFFVNGTEISRVNNLQ